MKKITLEFDFLIGPIMKDIFSIELNKSLTGISIIDNDTELEDLNEKASLLYSSYYEFDKESACSFNKSYALEHMNELEDLLKKIKDRLNLLNDGSFEIEDLATQQLEELKK